MTIYRPVPGYVDLYSGMDGSFVGGGRELTQTPSGNGYLKVYIPEIKRQKLAHRLMAAAFLGECPPGTEVRHGDGVRTNNQLDNLCYGTTRDNAQDAMRHGTHQGARMSAKTECPEGHSYSPENTYINPSTGGRHCRICVAAYQKEYRSRPENRARRNALWRARNANTRSAS